MEGLSIALAVVQFVDFTSKLVSAAWKIHSGEPSRGGERMSHLRTITEDLTVHNDGLKRNLTSPISSDAALLDLAEKCNNLGSRLIDTLNSLQKQTKPGHGRVWGSLRLALREKWHENDIKAMSEDLQNYRQQVILHVLTSHMKLTTSMNHEIKEEISSSSKDQLQAIYSLRTQLDNYNSKPGLMPHMQQFYDSGVMIATPPSQIHRALHGKDTTGTYQHIMDKLDYAEKDARYEQIVVAHERTFEWLFEAPTEPAHWSDFSRWLRSDGSIGSLYWITGKPGAGKSTLMRFLVDHERTANLSNIWKADRQLLRASFFFWNSGTPLQMSSEGLIRSLLHQILTQVPELTRIALPHRVLDIVLLGEVYWKERRWIWSRDELTNAFNTLVKEVSKTCNIMIFIDGMDEFCGDVVDVIEFVQGLCSTPRVKVCASSRPWNRFRDGFEQHPQLQVERLTYNDIHEYVDSKLRASPTFQGYESSHPGFPASLIEDVCTKADGVFLWVHIVTLSLLDGVMDGEKPIELQRRLEELPNELEMLFEKILWQTDPKDPNKLERASRLFQLHRAFPMFETPKLLYMSFADEFTIEDAMSPPIALSTEEQSHARAEQMRRRINACTRGLLDVHTQNSTKLSSARVVLLHRTVNDYLHREDVWATLCAATPPSFNPHGQLVGGYIMMLKRNSGGDELKRYATKVYLGMRCLQAAKFEDSAYSRYSQSLDTLYADLVCSPHDSPSIFTLAVTREWPETCNPPPSSSSLYSVFQIARIFGLSTYVERGLALLPSAIQSRTASYFLQISIWSNEGGPISNRRINNLNPDLLYMLFKCGADPNYKPRSNQTLADTFVKTMSNSDLMQIPRWPVVLEYFIDFGARFEEERHLLKDILVQIGSDRPSLREKIEAQLRAESASKQSGKGQTTKKKRLLFRSVFGSVRNSSGKEKA